MFLSFVLSVNSVRVLSVQLAGGRMESSSQLQQPSDDERCLLAGETASLYVNDVSLTNGLYSPFVDVVVLLLISPGVCATLHESHSAVD